MSGWELYLHDTAFLALLISAWSICARFYSRATLGGVIHISVPAQPTSSSFKVEISDGPVFPHVSCTPCGAKRQTFDYVNSVTPGNLGGKISERGSNPLLCVTASATTKDPDSGTPAIQMQPCSSTLDSTQASRVGFVAQVA